MLDEYVDKPSPPSQPGSGSWPLHMKPRQPFSLGGLTMLDEYANHPNSAAIARNVNDEPSLRNHEDSQRNKLQHRCQEPWGAGSSGSRSTATPAEIQDLPTPAATQQGRNTEPLTNQHSAMLNVESEGLSVPPTGPDPADDRNFINRISTRPGASNGTSRREDSIASNHRIEKQHQDFSQVVSRPQIAPVSTKVQSPIIPKPTDLVTHNETSVPQDSATFNSKVEEGSRDCVENIPRSQNASAPAQVPIIVNASQPIPRQQCADNEKPSEQQSVVRRPEGGVKNEISAVDQRPSESQAAAPATALCKRKHVTSPDDRHSMQDHQIVETIIVIRSCFMYVFDRVSYKEQSDINDRQHKFQASVIKVVEQFQEWQERWMVWVDNESFLPWLWGSEVKIVEKTLKDILREFKKLKTVSRILGRPLRCAIFPSTLAILRIRFERCKLSLYLYDPLKRIRLRLTRLNEISDSAFSVVHKLRDTEPGGHKSPETFRIHQHYHSRQLVSLAMETWKMSDDLRFYKLQHLPSSFTLELKIDMFSPNSLGRKNSFSMSDNKAKISAVNMSRNIPSRAEAIAKYSCHKRLCYTFAGLSAQAGYDPLYFSLIPATTLEDLKWTDYTGGDALNWADLASTVKKNLGANEQYEIKEATTVNKVRYCNIKSDVTKLSTPLRHALSMGQHMFSPDRAKNAFLLAEFGLLFFKTEWMQTICSCTIFHRPAASWALEEYSDSYQLTCKLVSSPAENDCWCAAKSLPEIDDHSLSRFKAYPLFYLGLVLIEILTAAPFVQVTLQEGVDSLDKIYLTYLDTHQKTGRSTMSSHQYLRHHELQEILYDPITFCLSKELCVKTVKEEDLKEYYWRVVAP
ncbi:hypothetical protein F4777DRAFT_575356 [Nemania sp. FL0916]|nr:hypothetical protein F4777DRAFT_575356 [Nemania sp. FL0916]